jgi:hypothetical protein
MSGRAAALALATLVLGIGAVGLLQQQVDANREADLSDELLYLPNEKLLDHFTVGQQGLVADLLWLQCIQYTAQEFRGDFKFTWLNQMCDNIVRLDPYFVDVYRWGGQFLAMLKYDSDASIDLMKRGVPDNPDSWELPFEIARTYILNRNDELAGAHYLAMAATTGDPPPFIVDWAKNLQSMHGLFDAKRRMWTDILENSEDDNMRELAKRRLIEVDLAEFVQQLNDTGAIYEERTGNRPTSFEDLVNAGLVQGQMPDDPLGGSFFVDSKGQFQNTSLLDSVLQERQHVLQGWIEKFKREEGRYPETLDELAASDHAPGLPNYPFEDRSWSYDPATGSVQ